MKESEPDSTAVRTALWRAMHVELDSTPHVIEDVIGLALAEDNDWRARPDMDPVFTRTFRASMVARARFVEDLLAEQVAKGSAQYVILGAGLDSFVQRHPGMEPWLRVFEVDRPEPQRWKRARLEALRYGVPDWLRFVPVDFEAGESWIEHLVRAGFVPDKPAVVAATGLSMYLSRDAIGEILRTTASFAPGSILAMTFMLPLENLPDAVRPGLERAVQGARSNGTPFVSFFTPGEMLRLARDKGLADARHV